MKNLILTLLFSSLFLANSIGQSDSTKFKLNRVYANVGFLIPRHFQGGVYIHFLDYFMLGGNMLSSTYLVAHKSNSFPYPSSRLYDEYTSKNLLVGFSTKFKRSFNVDLLIGLSELKGRINKNIQFYQNPIMQSDQKFKSKIVYFSDYGFVFRADINLDFHSHFGMNFSAQSVITKSYDQFNISIGFNFGLVQNNRDFKNKKKLH